MPQSVVTAEFGATKTHEVRYLRDLSPMQQITCMPIAIGQLINSVTEQQQQHCDDARRNSNRFTLLRA